MKRIIDTVHGEIIIPKQYFSEIIDTAEFQRLRHIDQSAIRSIFPCARHDRFVHSLGVFYIGRKIIKHLEETLSSELIESKSYQVIKESYILACLLHDVGHAPFSHTFEEYFGTQMELADRLNDIIKIVEHGKAKNTNYHEYTSAIIAIERFGKAITKFNGDSELVARMITGQKYHDCERSLENCFIELLHGDIIDADRIDYACRDVWASGYATAKFDVGRLIDAIIIELDKDSNNWQLLFKGSVINEIESLLKIREFQNRYVIGHHKVIYDQHLLVKAIEYSAINLISKEEQDEIIAASKYKDQSQQNLKYKAVAKICSLQNLTKDGDMPYLSDADLIHLIKKDRNNDYAKQWFSRQYIHIPLWKSLLQFNYYFPFLKGYSLDCIQFKEVFEKAMDNLGIKDAVVYKTKIKGDVDLTDVKIKIGENPPVGINEVYEFNSSNIRDDKVFFYAYIPKTSGLNNQEIIDKLTDPLREAFKAYMDTVPKEENSDSSPIT